MGLGFSQVCLELGEGHLDGIEVGTVGWKEEEPGTPFLEDGSCFLALVARQIVEDDHVAGLERRGELGLDPGLEDVPVHGTVDDPGCGQPIVTQRRDEGLRSPVAERRFHLQPPPPARPTAQPGHLRRRPRLIDKSQSLRALLHPRLTVRLPYPARTHDVGAIGLARQQRFF